MISTTLKMIFTAALLAIPATAMAQGRIDALTTDPVPDREATLKVWSFLPGNYEAGEEAFAKSIGIFEAAHPGITVEITEMPYGTYFDQIRNSIVAQTGPDVITMYGAAQAYSYKDGLFPLQDVIDPTLRQSLKFVDENYSSDGNLYILPTGTYGYMLLVNEDIFASAGIDPAKGLADWPSMLKTCQALSASGIDPISSGWRDGYMLETYVYMLSSQLMDDEMLAQWVAGDLPMDAPVFHDVMGYIVEMRDAGCFGGDDALGRNMWDDTINRYGAGEAAMVVVATMGTADWASADQPNSSAHALPMVPTSPNPKMIDAGAEAGWAVTRWTENPEAALALVNHFGNFESQAIFAEMAGVPANLTGAEFAAESPLHKGILKLMELPGNHTTFAAFPLTALAVVERNAVPLMSGDMSIEDFLSAAQRAFSRTR